MTIPVNNYEPVKTLGNGSTVEFSFGWNVINEDYMRVYLEDVTTGAQVLQTLGSDYTLEFTALGGTVTFAVAPENTHYSLLARDTAITQETGYSTSSGFQGVVTENDFDKVTAIAQDANYTKKLTMQFPLGTDVSESTGVSTEMPTYDAGKGLMWDETEKKLVVSTDNFNDIVTDATAQADRAETAADEAETAQAAAEAAQSGSETARDESVTAKNDSETARDLSEDWASKTDGQVAATDYSSKAYAIGGTGTETNNSKYWAELAESYVGDINERLELNFFNDTGSEIPKGKVLHPIGGTIHEGEVLVTVEYADASDFEETQGTLFVAKEAVPNNTAGVGLRFGKVIDFDTSSFGAGVQLWLSCDGSGDLTDTKPVFPCYAISMGGTLTSAVDGEVFISITGALEDTFHEAWDGAIRETFDFRTTSSGGTITGTLTNPNATHTNLTLLFSEGMHTLELPASGSITLTGGTATVPQMNYVYIPMSTKVLTVSTSGFPAAEHCKVAKLYLQDATTIETVGALRNQNINDHIKTDDDNGHILHMAERIRKLPAAWDSGSEATLTGTTTNVYIATTAGKVFQMHKQIFPAQDMSTGDYIHVVNDPTTPYRATSNLNDITEYSDGSSWNNQWGSLVVWGVCNKTGEDSHIMVNLPSDGYNSEADAVADADGYANYTIPETFNGVGFLIGRFTIRRSGSTFTYNSGVGYQDLRGFFPNNTAGGGAGSSGITTFLGLTDTPSAYAGQAGKVPTVNSGETALEFTTVGLPIGYINGGIISNPAEEYDYPIMTAEVTGTFSTIGNVEVSPGADDYLCANRDSSDSWGTGTVHTGNEEIIFHNTAGNTVFDTLGLEGYSPGPFSALDIYTSPDGITYTLHESLTGLSTATYLNQEVIPVDAAYVKFKNFDFADSGAWFIVERLDVINQHRKEINITASSSRSSDDTQDIEVSSDSLDISVDANWASGTAPSLTTTTVHVWTDYNSGTPKYVFDDITGSNITGAKRRVGSFITDSSADIIPFTNYETAGGGVVSMLSSVITELAATTTGDIELDVSVPTGIEVGWIGYDIMNSTGSVTTTFKNNGGDSVKHFSDGWGTMAIDHIYTSDATIDINVSTTLTNHFIDTRGYTDERGV